MKLRSLDQFHPIAHPGDAVTNGMFLTQRLLRELGFASQVYAAHQAPGLEDRVRPHTAYKAGPDRVLLVHHSHGHEVEAWLRDLPVRQFLVYHNITPEAFFPPGSLMHRYAILGREMLPRYRQWMQGALCDSQYNAEELLRLGYTNVVDLPLLFDLDAIRHAPVKAAMRGLREPGGLHLLFVGRLAVNKCQHDLIRMAWFLRQLHGGPLRLTLVGHLGDSRTGDNFAYARMLTDWVRDLGLDEQVRFTGHVSTEELYGWYRWADLFVCMSEHEGFGVPLVEAMAFDLPVLAYGSSNIPHTLGAGGLVVTDKDHARFAAAIKVVMGDPSALEALSRGRQARLAELSRQRQMAGLSDFLTAQGVTVPRPGGAAARAA